MTDRERVRRGYDEYAAAYADRRTTDDRERRILDAVLDGLPGNARVLDAGCGAGEPVLRRLDGTASAVGLDVSREQLLLAADAVPAAGLAQGDLAALPFAADTFDAVVAVDSVIHVPVPEHPRVFAEFARVLRPGGWLLVSEGEVSFERRTTDWLGEGGEMTWHVAGPEATRNHLRDAGFTVEEEWAAPEGEEPKPPFFLARVD